MVPIEVVRIQTVPYCPVDLLLTGLSLRPWKFRRDYWGRRRARRGLNGLHGMDISDNN